MRRGARALVALAFTAVVVEAPWLHVHRPSADPDHYRQQHAGLNLMHGHGHDAARHGSALHDREPAGGGDVLFLGRLNYLRVVQVPLDLIDTRVQGLVAPLLGPIGQYVELSPRAHGPPGLNALPPRAPPA